MNCNNFTCDNHNPVALYNCDARHIELTAEIKPYVLDCKARKRYNYFAKEANSVGEFWRAFRTAREKYNRK